ncbi:dihydroxyacetone kinase phosphotransfer subunit [Kineosphaera limosa]|uniref:Phosphocarrier protein HPr n=1 Tax=Kineosphaera limosa NBRC 100340 TaxID=1184609 RepID=K6WRV7_9MICO|nr:dihydroxyacetone kinase phosphoryl donor subunit DhaM [Kineosphaera limosa]NYE01218.1 dihydroxyacetone kinase phosphotransfer subunit [Kineosphaera limosa]GAB96581.1 dihydroxyacetone kinase phosphotransferase subunit DhaM [Kineosphaera limosa NBRC 100340]
MIGLVVVSHSWPLAQAAIELALEMVGDGRAPIVLPAAGLDETTLGTDAAAIAEALERADSGDGVLVLVDLGSAVLSAELAVEFVDPDLAERVLISPAPLVEGLVAAVVAAAAGRGLRDCDAEARRGLAAKVAHLGDPAGPGDTTQERVIDSAAVEPELVFTSVIDLPDGLHARPAAALAGAVGDLDVEAYASNLGPPTSGPSPTQPEEVDAGSAMSLLTLGLRHGDTLHVRLRGPDADAALAALQVLAAARFGEQ